MTEPTATFTTEGHTPVLIEDWLPIRELGIESVREAAPIPGQFPKLKTLHVWWARAPLAAANGVVLASLLPTWSPELFTAVPELRQALARTYANRPDLQRTVAQPTDRDLFLAWVLWVSGVRGDSVRAKELSQKARSTGQRLDHNPFTWKPAFRNAPSIDDLRVVHDLLVHRWGRMPRLLDPTAGGGSIPYASLRYGLQTWANDLNPVAVGVLDAGLRASSEFGPELVDDLKKWGSILVEKCVERLLPLFPAEDSSEVPMNYLFANTVSCPRTGGPVPLSPNWWIDKDGDKIAVEVTPKWASDGSPLHIEFTLSYGPEFDFDPDDGTVSGGDAISPWDGLVIAGDYIKSESREGRMWPTLYCVRVKRPATGRRKRWVYSFRGPSEADHSALRHADELLESHEEQWSDVIPTEMRPDMHPKNMIYRYGFYRWRDFFTNRQLFVHGVFVEEWLNLRDEVRAALGQKRGDEVLTLLALMQGKGLAYNSRQSRFDPGRGLRNAFERHDFALKFTYGEFEGARELWPWCLDQLVSAYKDISQQLLPEGASGLLDSGELQFRVPGRVALSAGSASDLSEIDDGSIECVNIDPPYYDNVMYAELSDFFYVWEKRTIGTIQPGRFENDLTSKDDEAIANVSRFDGAGKRKKELATFDYQQKMLAIFAECCRVLVDDGVMVVWFTHKKAEAWDTLATAMMEAGFTIEASWPVSTQSESALNHAKKNSAKSTIMLVCRKRSDSRKDETFFEDIEAEVRHAARRAVEKFEAEVGIGGVDLQLATYGPTLSVISRSWPVLSSEPDETGRSRRLRPEEALDVARQEVARLRMARLVGKDATFDPATDFWLMCWETFQAREFPYDEARKLALGVGYDVDDAMSSGLLKKKAANVELVSPASRGRALRRSVDDAGRFDRLVDAVQFMLVTYRDDKLAAARTWLSDSGYGEEQRFTDAVQAAVNAVPRVRSKKGLTLDEAVLLEDAVVGLFGDEVSLPVEAEELVEAEQLKLDG